jgi:penicillin-binding protein 2
MPIGHEEKISSAKLTGVQYTILGIFLLLIFGLWRLQVAGNADPCAPRQDPRP